MVTKKDLTEQEIRSRYIMPALRDAGWGLDQIREEYYLTYGQLYPRGQTALHGKRKFADYVLYHHNKPLAVVEAKDNNHPLGGGMQQHPQVFRKGSKRLYTKWTTVYVRRFLTKRDYEDADFDTLAEKVEKEWARFLDQDLSALRKSIVAAEWPELSNPME